MNQLPDAPWIRDAEQNGIDDADPVKCPVCGDECDWIFVDAYGEAVGCENCLVKRDSWIWDEERRST